MNLNVTINDKPVQIKLTKPASRAMEQRTTPLIVEMELYFSCLIRKKVRFYETSNDTEHTIVNENFSVRFRPVMTQSCSISDVKEGNSPTLTDFPIANPKAYVPHWLRIDYRSGEWCGEFGYGA